MIYLMDLQALDNNDQPVTLRFSSKPYIDSNLNTYDVKVKQPCKYISKAFGNVIPGTQKSSYGEAILLNKDGSLNYLADYSIDGRSLSLRILQDDGVTISSVLSGTVSGMSFKDTDISIALEDRRDFISVPHPQSTYGGTNVLPDGIDGVATDIKGKNIPRVYGRVRNATPVLVNSVRYIYQVSDRTDNVVSAVYDRGVALTFAGYYSSLADMQANPPAAGFYKVWQGFFRIGANPTGTITCDADSPVTFLGDVFALLCSETNQSVNVTPISILNSVGEVGIYLTDSKNTSDLLDLLINSAGGYWSYDALGVIQTALLDVPANPILTIDNSNIKTPTIKQLGCGPNGLPYWRVQLTGDVISTVQTDLASSVTPDRVGRLASATRQVTVDNTIVQTRHPLAQIFSFATCLYSMSDVQRLAVRLSNLFSTRRDSTTLDTYLNPATISSISLGTICSIITSRIGYSSGRTQLVVGYEIDALRSKVILDLWG